MTPPFIPSAALVEQVEVELSKWLRSFTGMDFKDAEDEDAAARGVRNDVAFHLLHAIAPAIIDEGIRQRVAAANGDSCDLYLSGKAVPRHDILAALGVPPKEGP